MDGSGPGLEIVAIVVGIVLGAIFAGLDAALAELGEVHLGALRDAGGRDATTAARALANLDVIQARLLTGRVVCLALVVASASGLTGSLEGHVATLASVAGVALAYAICAETTITIARARAGRWALAALRLFRPVELLLAPVAFPLVLISRSLRKKLPEPAPTEEQARVAELAVEHIIDEGAEAGSITKDHAAMLHSVLEFKNTIAREVMVPRTKMIAFEASTPLEEVLALGVAEGHSRYPVYRDKIDQVEGVLHVKDLSKITGTRPSMEGISLASILRKPFFVAETQKIGTLLREMQQKRVHLAIVVDEFGGTAGIVTLEDILEEIVGDIRDEHDEDEQPAREISPGRWSVDAGMSVHDLGELLGGPLVPGESEGGYDSVGGLVVDVAGQVPAVGERVEVGAYDVVVRDADEKKVRRVEIRKRPRPPETAVA